MSNAAESTRAAQQPHRWIALGVLAAGLSMIVLDGTIVGVALPTIIDRLGLNLNDAQWVNSLYSVVFAALLLSAGRLGDRLGRRNTFLAGTSIFVVGSIMAALSDSASGLVWARVVQGIGGALVLPSTLSTVNAVFRGKERAAAFGVWGAVMSGMAAVGPLLGGWLTESFDWTWIFWVNVPLGALVLIGTLVWVPQTFGKPAGRGVDVDGLLTSGIGFGLIVFALIEGNTLGWWTPKADLDLLGLSWPATRPISIVPIAAAVGLLFVGLFLLWERHRARVRRDALLDLTLFRTRTFSWGNITAGMVAIGEFALVFVLPLYLVNAVGLSTLQTGVALATMALGAFVAGASARHVAARFGAPAVVMIGLSLELVGVLTVALAIGAGTTTWVIAALLVIYGVGLGLASAQLTSTVLGDIAPEQSGEASATQSTVRQLGAAFGSAIAGAALAAGLSANAADAVRSVPGVPAQAVPGLADGVINSAGGSIAGLRAAGEHSQLGTLTPQVVDALSGAFASATRLAVLIAAAFLALGLFGAVRVAAAARRTPQRSAQTSDSTAEADES